MTLTDAQVVTTTDEATTVAARPSSTTRVPIRRRVAVISTGLLVLVVAVWALFSIFEGPLATKWYESRQRALAADFLAPHPHKGLGHAIAILQVPRLGMNLVVAEGDSAQQLRSGPGHRVGTAAPGTLGNSVVLGHHDAWGGPFGKLDQLHAGDLIAVQTPTPDGESQTAVYRVQSLTHVSADDTAPFARSNDYRLTLMTGRGDRYSSDRLVVTAVSGDTGRVRAPADDVKATTSSGSVLTNSTTLLALLAIAVALGAWLFLRRRYHRAVALAVIAPLVAVAILGAWLSIDLLFPPLR
jgi:LPXTG-site transpeptidase (sortase) family protein